ncbi:MAG: M48 family peptidase [Betaproteobacteria bacterium]|nr:M48 family peptidase [Betaproteobacteria bacterium]
MTLRFPFLAILLASSALSWSADNLPDLGDVSETAISAQQERRLGESIMQQIRGNRAYLDDLEVVEYLNALGHRLAFQSQDLRFAFEFFGIDDPSVNAFALPGGFIGVHTGLLLTAESESELASVLGHEVAHVSQRHLARLIAAQQKSQVASIAALALAILAARSSPDLAQAAMAGAQYASIQTQLNFTRDHEREADRIGVQLLEQAGFDARAMPVFFERLQRATRVYDSNAPSYARTHPVTYERIADIQNRVEALPYRQVPDSLDFLLLRTKLQVRQMRAQEALAYFESQLKEKRFTSEAAARYGLVASLLEAKKTARAVAELPSLLDVTKHHAIADTLVGQVLAGSADAQGASAFYERAYERHPRHRALVTDYARHLLAQKRPAEALKLTTALLATGVNDGRLYELQAQSYAGLGKRLQQHRAQAEAYLIKGSLPGAIEQLEIGLRAGDGDYYDSSSAESRLKELKHQDAELRRK